MNTVMKVISSPLVWMITGVVATIVLVTALALFLRKLKEVRRNSRLLGARLRDIGEFAVEEARCTVVHCTKEPRHFFTMELPLIRERCIFAVDVIVKIGFDFDEIDVQVDVPHKQIVMKLPEMRILSSAVDFESLVLYDEKTSVFGHPRMEYICDSMQGIQTEAERKLVDIGAYERAEENAKLRLEAFVAKLFNLTEYRLVIYPNGEGRSAAMTLPPNCA